MSNEQTKKLSEKTLSWLGQGGEDSDVILSSRVTMTRNLSQFRFPGKAESEELEAVFQKIMSSLEAVNPDASAMLSRITDLADIDKQILLERKLLSETMVSKDRHSGVSLLDEGDFSVMINEEDHLKIQAVVPGLDLLSTWGIIQKTGERLAANLIFAYDKTLGFLTARPLNVGTGAKFSVLLQLPGLTLTRQLPAVARGAAMLGLNVRRQFGKDAETSGYLFVLSNQSTLGETEINVLTRIRRAVKQLLPAERLARNTLLHDDCNRFYDYIGRAYGRLRYAYRLRKEECFQDLCLVRIGTGMDMFSCLDIKTLDELITVSQTAHLRARENISSDSEEVNYKRAEIVRHSLARASE